MFDNYSTNSKADRTRARKRFQLKSLLLTIAVWLACPFIVFALPGDYPSIVPLVMMSVPVTGFGLIVGFSVVLIKRGWDPNPVMAILLVSAICLQGLGTIYQLGARAHLLTNGSRYQRIIEQIDATTDDDERTRICGDTCSVFSTDPRRISFHYGAFFLSWTNLVYDPSGSMANIKDIESRHRLSIYFISAEHLTGDWYLAHFSD